MILYFLFEDGSYSVGEEYIVYDTSNFIADVGGYLGLLVGQSILGLYYWSAEWLAKLKIWWYVYNLALKVNLYFFKYNSSS